MVLMRAVPKRPRGILEVIAMAHVAQAGRPFELHSRWIKRHPMRLSALLALKEALLRERYEECAEIVAIAKEFGARPHEIYYLLEDPRRNP